MKNVYNKNETYLYIGHIGRATEAGVHVINQSQSRIYARFYESGINGSIFSDVFRFSLQLLRCIYHKNTTRDKVNTTISLVASQLIDLLRI